MYIGKLTLVGHCNKINNFHVIGFNISNKINFREIGYRLKINNNYHKFLWQKVTDSQYYVR